MELPRVIEIGRFAFGSGNLSNLKTVVIGDTIQRFYTNSFSNTSLTSLAITGVDSSKWASLGFLDYGAAERFPNKQAFYGRLTPCARTIVDDGYISDAEKVYIGKIRIETPEALALQLKKKKTDRYDDCYLTNNYVYSVLKQADYDPTLESGWFITDIVNPKYLEYFNNTYK